MHCNVTHWVPLWSLRFCSTLQSCVQIQSSPLIETHTETKSQLTPTRDSPEPLAEVVFTTYAHIFPPDQSILHSLIAASSAALLYRKMKSGQVKMLTFEVFRAVFIHENKTDSPFISAWALACSLSLAWSRLWRADLKQWHVRDLCMCKPPNVYSVCFYYQQLFSLILTAEVAKEDSLVAWLDVDVWSCSLACSPLTSFIRLMIFTTGQSKRKDFSVWTFGGDICLLYMGALLFCSLWK